MTRTKSAKVLATLGCALLAGTAMAPAADVTFERLRNPEPQNWLMNHGDFGAQRFSALAAINTSNAKNLKLAFAVAIGGASGNENLTATPLVEDGFMYIPDAWGMVYKIDVRSGTSGPIVWKMDPGQEKVDRNRGVALWGNLVISVTSRDGRVIATDKETGKIVWDKNLNDKTDMTLNAAPLALKDSILVGASGGDGGIRNWLVSLDPKTGNEQWRLYSIGSRRPVARPERQEQRLADRRRRLLRHRPYDPATNITYWGAGNPSPKYDSSYGRATTSIPTARSPSMRRPARSSGTIHAQRHDGLRRGRHAHPDRHQGQWRRPQDPRPRRAQRLQLFDRLNGQFIKATYYVVGDLTKGIDPKTGRPIDYDPAKDTDLCRADRKILTGAKSSGVCPGVPGGSNFGRRPTASAPSLYIPELEGCTNITRDQTRHVKGKFDGGDFGYDGRLRAAYP